MRYRKRKINKTAFLFILPSLIAGIMFMFFPIVFSLILSFNSWNVISSPIFVGLKNYIEILMYDQIFYLALKNTFYYLLLNVPLLVITSLFFALLVNQATRRFHLFDIFKSFYFLPTITSLVAAALIWRLLLTPSFGLLNYFLRILPLVSPQEWLMEPKNAMWAIVVMSVWKNAGWYMIIFLAGLQAIPVQFYDAAYVDGVSGWQKFVYITIPLLAPTTFFIVIITLIDSFKVFDQVYIMTKGGPMNATKVVNYYLYQQAFKVYKMGYASAIAWVLFLVIMVFTLFQFKFLGKKYYQW